MCTNCTHTLLTFVLYILANVCESSHPHTWHTQHIGAAHNYPSSSAAKAAISNLGREIQCGLLPEVTGPMIFTFTGMGNVSQVKDE